MNTPKTLKSALESGYRLKKMNYKNSSKCRVDVEPRFYKAGMKAILSFWISSAYIKRTYPKFYNTSFA